MDDEISFNWTTRHSAAFGLDLYCVKPLVNRDTSDLSVSSYGLSFSCLLYMTSKMYRGPILAQNLMGWFSDVGKHACIYSCINRLKPCIRLQIIYKLFTDRKIIPYNFV